MEMLKKQLGKENVSIEKIDKISYSFDASQEEGNAVMVVWPESIKHVSEIMIFANRMRYNIVPRGAGTGLVGGAIPQGSLVIDFSKMNNFEIRPGFVIAEPGVILDDLNNALDKYFFPVIPGSHSVCTIGGMIATNAAGHKSMRYGKTSDWIVELEVIDGTGKQLKIHGEQLNDFIGKEGTTGLIVKATLRLTEIPEVKTISLLSFNDINNLIEQLDYLKRNGDISSIEYIDKITSELIGLPSKFHLLVEYESDAGEIKDQSKIQELWKKRDNVYPVLTKKGYTKIEDPLIPSEKMAQFLYWLEKNNIPSYGHIATNIIHPQFKPTQKITIDAMYRVVKDLKGSVSGEHGIGLLKKQYIDQNFKIEIEKLKQKYDPKNVMNIGKII